MKKRSALSTAGLAAGLLLSTFGAAHAAGTAMPWDSPLQTLKTDLTGPVAGAVALIAIVASGGALVFGGEISDFTKRILYLVLAISVVIGASTILSAIGSTSGALIPA